MAFGVSSELTQTITSLSLWPQMGSVDAVDTRFLRPCSPFPFSWRQGGGRHADLVYSTATPSPRTLPERQDSTCHLLDSWPHMIVGNGVPLLHVPREDQIRNEKCKQPEHGKHARQTTAWRLSVIIQTHEIYSSFPRPAPAEQAHPSPTNLIKRQSAHNQKCLKEQAINSSHMLNKWPGCRQNGSSAALRERFTLC